MAGDPDETPAGASETSSDRRRALVAAAIGVVIVVVVAGVVVAWIRRPRPRAEVVIVGDSVTYLSSPSILRRLDDRATVQIKSVPMYRTADLVEPFQTVIDGRRADGRPLSQVLVLAGYNDVARRDADSGGLDRLMAQAAEFDCAVWLTLPETPEHRKTADADLTPAAARAWNERVRTVAREHPNVHVSTAWADLVDGAEPGELLQSDALHPIFPGQEALAREMDGALEQACGR